MYLGILPGGTAPCRDPGFFSNLVPISNSHPRRNRRIMPATVPWPIGGSLDPAALVDARLQAHRGDGQAVAGLMMGFRKSKKEQRM